MLHVELGKFESFVDCFDKYLNTFCTTLKFQGKKTIKSSPETKIGLLCAVRQAKT